MRLLLRILFLPFKILGGSQISGFLINMNKKMPWLNAVLALIIAAIAMFVIYGV